MTWLSSLLLVLLLHILVLLLREYKDPKKLMAWLTVAFIAPYLAIILYWIAAREYGVRRRSRLFHQGSAGLPASLLGQRSLRATHLSQYPRLQHQLGQITNYPPCEASNTTIYTGARAFYRDLLRDLERAEDHIHLQFYIFRDDEIGGQVMELLKSKAAHGVEVRMILDGIGSLRFPQSRIRELLASGVQVHIFLPTMMSILHKRINYRNHRKIVVCDGRAGYFGGMNIGDEYLGGDESIGPWRDTHLRIEGEAVYALQHTFLRDWKLVSGEDRADHGKYYPEFMKTTDSHERTVMHLIPGGPDQAEQAMFALFYGMLTVAEKRIYVTTPYFVPEDSIMTALKTAAQSGVDVRLLIPGVSDTRLGKLATMAHVEELLTAGVRVYEYQRGFIHAKSVIIDSQIATVGTANMDMRSFFSNFELNALIYTRSAVEELEAQFMSDLENSVEINDERFRRRTRWERTLEAGARMLSPFF